MKKLVMFKKATVIAIALGLVVTIVFGFAYWFFSPYLGSYHLVLTLPADAHVQSPQAASYKLGEQTNIYDFYLSGNTKMKIVKNGVCYVWICRGDEPAGEEYVSLDSATIHSLTKCQE